MSESNELIDFSCIYVSIKLQPILAFSSLTEMYNEINFRVIVIYMLHGWYIEVYTNTTSYVLC